jgi:arginine/lysine/ornithine decarboxylase
MEHTRAPVLEALGRYHRECRLPFTPPGHKQARGADPEVREVLGEAVFASDVLAMNGLDDRRATGGVLRDAERLMADAVRAEHTFFSTCGSSLSVKAAMLAVAGPTAYAGTVSGQSSPAATAAAVTPGRSWVSK